MAVRFSSIKDELLDDRDREVESFSSIATESGSTIATESGSVAHRCGAVRRNKKIEAQIVVSIATATTGDAVNR